jgi:murein DD-endopeptidase MepM/ murein hydrolase activator NlpD
MGIQRSGGGFPAFFLVILVVGGFGFLVIMNSRPAQELRVIVPTESNPTPEEPSWQTILRQGFGSNSTPLPTVAIPTGEFIPPTLPAAALINATPFAPQAIGDSGAGILVAVTPTLPPASPTALATNILVTVLPVTRAPQEFQLPPLIPPISHDPLGRDHYWLRRPVDSSALNNRGLFYYAYGSDGPENQWRIHTGLDMPNPIGETLRAAGDGVVEWAGEGFQNTSSYGRVVFMRHNFGYEGEAIYTLYAHLAAILVFPGQIVREGDAIGLIGNTGQVSGPHVHFEIRMGGDAYGNTYNPLLWMVPYVSTGVIAGRVLDANGDWVMDADVTIRNWGTGTVTDTTTTYVFEGTQIDVNPDPIWRENFVAGDIPLGRHEVITTIDGQRVSQIVNVVEGTTAFVELSLAGQ